MGVPDIARLQRRTLTLLVAAQVVGGLGIGSAISVGAILALRLSGSEQWSGLAGTMITLGAGAIALPLARLAASKGRRISLSLGWLVAAAGALVTLLAATVSSFVLLLAGLLLVGSGTATNLQSRYAATDLADPRTRARDLSIVVWSTTVGSVLGPNLTGPGEVVAGWLSIPPVAGPFVFSAAGFGLAFALIASRLRPDPLLIAQARREQVNPGYQPAKPSGSALMVIRKRPAALIGLSAMVLSQGIMVAVMTMTPVHMDHHGAELRLVGLTISLHIAGMYALSPVVGWLTDRLGRRPVIIIGQLVLVASAITAGTAHHSTPQLTIGLVLLGLGWSAGLVAGSTLLTESVPDEARTRIQGTSDVLMSLMGAVGGGLSGVILGATSFGTLNALAAVLVIPTLALIAIETVTRRRRPHDDAPVSLER
ncbi:MFS transporter [Phytoactinopolyspora mesophila]|uniref:MFS transporter n=1 Tax=Phytoactinopolyspora mesophila TaxID=2650750 RepID=A0A7K3M5Z7_9ACTN|nr:MFS transporter [Phytoactinopolyspora mesophila]NDL57858.1 MFS transporter [Phytoactinopolyspora mesophila]